MIDCYLSMVSFKSAAFAVVVLLVSSRPTVGFSVTDGFQKVKATPSVQTSRRDFAEQFGAAALLSVVVTVVNPTSVEASGGATAGGAYLLSAKQRYNERVKAGVKGYIAAGSALEKGDIDSVRAFFTSEEEGTWKDFSTAAYLLANAFRRNSTAAPDSLPSVKKWKAFAAQVEGMTKALKKKDSQGGLAAYKNSLPALDDYLAQVDLPSAKEING